jgi:lysozyme
MTKNKKAVLGILATALILYMFRTRIAKTLNKTPFGTISDNIFNFIGGWEKFTPVAYWDNKQYSVGYGSGFNWDENRPVQKGDVIGKETAKQWLLKEAQKDYSFVQSIVKVPVSNNQLIALSSFSYNEGRGALQSSTLLKLLNAGYNFFAVANEFDKWVYSDGKISIGLQNRRNAEKKLFLS